MKKLSHFLNDQSGFYLPYVLCITVIILMTVATYVNLYKQDIQVTHQHLEQLNIETLTQMAYQKFKIEFPTSESRSFEVLYTFPTGTVNLRYKIVDEAEYKLQFDVLTSNNSAYATYKPIDITSEN